MIDIPGWLGRATQTIWDAAKNVVATVSKSTMTEAWHGFGGTNGDWVDQAINFTYGAGDAVLWNSSRLVRRSLFNDQADYHSVAYTTGGWAGWLGEVAFGAGLLKGGAKKLLQEGGKQLAEGAATRLATGNAITYLDDLARLGTRNPDSSKVVLGKFLEDGQSYVKVGAHYKASYLKLEKWRELAGSLTSDELWGVNRSFLKQQIKAGKDIILSHDPSKATGFFLKEVAYLEQLGFKFIKDGWIWRAVQ